MRSSVIVEAAIKYGISLCVKKFASSRKARQICSKKKSRSTGSKDLPSNAHPAWKVLLKMRI